MLKKRPNDEEKRGVWRHQTCTSAGHFINIICFIQAYVTATQSSIYGKLHRPVSGWKQARITLKRESKRYPKQHIGLQKKKSMCTLQLSQATTELNVGDLQLHYSTNLTKKHKPSNNTIMQGCGRAHQANTH